MTVAEKQVDDLTEARLSVLHLILSQASGSRIRAYPALTLANRVVALPLPSFRFPSRPTAAFKDKQEPRGCYTDCKASISIGFSKFPGLGFSQTEFTFICSL